jgi:hypothetical protein
MTNECFDGYKDIHKGYRAILIGSGPTVKKFKDINDHNTAKIGVNEVLHLPIKLQYYFTGDSGPYRPEGYLSNKKIYHDYKPTIQKFIRTQLWGKKGEVAQDMKHAHYYECNLGKELIRDIDTKPLNDCTCISFEALQFILFCGFSEIHLVGQDCNYEEGTFKTPSSNDEWHKKCGGAQIRQWEIASSHIEKYHPDTKVFSVRPVGLKGLFPESNIC